MGRLRARFVTLTTRNGKVTGEICNPHELGIWKVTREICNPHTRFVTLTNCSNFAGAVRCGQGACTVQVGGRVQGAKVTGEIRNLWKPASKTGRGRLWVRFITFANWRGWHFSQVWTKEVTGEIGNLCKPARQRVQARFLNPTNRCGEASQEGGERCDRLPGLVPCAWLSRGN